jgi:predicted nucleic acid-binding protein
LTLYVDSSALVKQYAYEPDAEVAGRILASDSRWVSSRLTLVEVRRALSRELRGRRLGEARTQFSDDWSRVNVVDPDELLCETAADIAESTGVRTLDAVHLATAQRAGAPALSFVTFDRHQARAARSLGWPVLGV